jgi:hypothetical protein
MEFKQEWHKKFPGKVFNVNMKDVIFKCQVPLFDTDSYGETVVRVYDCAKKVYNTFSHKEWLKRQKCAVSRDCKESCLGCEKDGEA